MLLAKDQQSKLRPVLKPVLISEPLEFSDEVFLRVLRVLRVLFQSDAGKWR